MRRQCLLILAVQLIATTLCLAADANEQAVIDLVAKYAAARENRDADALAAILTDDADQLVSSGVWRRGKDELVKGMLGSSRQNPGQRTLTVETVRFVTADVAIANARYVISRGEGAEPRRMWSTFVAQRTSNGWRLAAIRNMLPAQ